MAREVLITVKGEDGEKQRVPARQVSDSTLKWYASREGSDPVLEACRAEIERRASGGKREFPREESRPEAPPQVTLAEVHGLCGAIDDPGEAAARLQRIQELGHLVSPAPMVGTIPDGCALSISAVMVANIDRETYPIKGSSSERGLHAVFLDRIAGAAGIDWLSTGRLDDGGRPYYCRYRVTGRVRQFDLSFRHFEGTRPYDMTEEGPVVLEIRARELKEEADLEAANKPYKGDHGALEIANKRRHLDALCETAARGRAIRHGLGLSVKYTRAELGKPFFVVGIQLTGRFSDPEARREYAQLVGRSFLGDDARVGASRMLFGPSVVQALPSKRIVEAPGAPVAVPAAQADDDDDDFPLDLPLPKASNGSRY